MATKVLQAMATRAAVDSPIALSSDSIMKKWTAASSAGRLTDWILSRFHGSFGSVLGNERDRVLILDVFVEAWIMNAHVRRFTLRTGLPSYG